RSVKKKNKYTHYTIDLRENHRPICKCMTQTTLRDILRLAMTKSAVPMNTGKENLDRVWAIEHPDEENYDRRQETQTNKEADELRQRQRQQAEAEKETIPAPVNNDMNGNKAVMLQTVECFISNVPEGDGNHNEEKYEKEE
ncbi:hypothetical protein CPC16_008476, partial [Podila verticillata]